MLRTMGLVVVAWLCTQLPAVAEVQVQYDRFKQKTVVAIGPKFGETHPTLYVLSAFDGESLSKRPDVVAFMFSAKSESWQYLDCHTTSLLVDGKPLPLETEHDGSVMSGGDVIEYIKSMITFEKFQQIASAKKVEVQICNTEFSLSDEDMNDLKQFVNLITPKTKNHKKPQTDKPKASVEAGVPETKKPVGGK